MQKSATRGVYTAGAEQRSAPLHPPHCQHQHGQDRHQATDETEVNL